MDNAKRGKRIEISLGKQRRMKEHKAWTVPSMVRIETPADKSPTEIIEALGSAIALLEAEREGMAHES